MAEASLQAVPPSEKAAAGKPIVQVQGLRKQYGQGEHAVMVLDGIDLTVPEGAFEALMGPSGSGKTTLLNLIAGIDRPSSGSILVAGTELSRLSEGELAAWRSRHIGFVFQFYNLLPVLTAAENVEMPLLLTKLGKSERRQRVETALTIVGLKDRMGHTPRQLSGGQEQRVAIARAIVSDPAIIVADEPTGDLDRKSGDEVLELLGTLNAKFNKTILMVTHDQHAADRAKIVRRLEKGVLVETVPGGSIVTLTGLAVRNGLLRNKTRAILTILGVAALILAFVFLRTTVSSFYEGPEHARSDRLSVRNRISLIVPLPLADFDKIKAVPGVSKVTYSNWFGGVYRDPRNFFPKLAVDPATYFDVYSESKVAPEDMAAFRADRTGCLIGEQLVKTYGFKKGDTIKVKGDIYPGDWAFHVDGVFRSTDAFQNGSMFFQWKYLDSSLDANRQGYVGTYGVVVDNADQGAAVSRAIDALFAGSASETKTESEKTFILSFVTGSAAILDALQVISIVLLFIMLLILVNTLTMALRERTSELGVLRTLGYRPGQLMSLALQEGTVLALVGGVVGSVLAVPIIRAFGDLSGGYIHGDLALVWMGPALGIAMGIGLLSSFWPAYRASKIDIVQALRRLE